MMLKKDYGKSCLCVDLKTACYIIGYFLAVVHTALLLIVTYTIVSGPLTLSVNDPLAMKKLMTILAFGQIAFPICVSNTKFTIMLLVGLHVLSLLQNVYSQTRMSESIRHAAVAVLKEFCQKCHNKYNMTATKSVLRMKLYLICATCMAVGTVFTGFAMEYLLHIDLAASLSVLINLLNAYFLYTIWRYMKQIEPKNTKLQKETV